MRKRRRRGINLKTKEFFPPDHIAGAALERDGHLNTVSYVVCFCVRACIRALCAGIPA